MSTASRRWGAAPGAIACLALAPAALPESDLHARLLELGAAADTTIFEEGPLSNGAGSFMFAGSTGQGDRRRALVRFDLSPIPRGAQVTMVELRLFMSKTSSGPQSVSLHRLLESWGEGDSDSDLEGGGGQGAPATPGDAPLHKSNEGIIEPELGMRSVTP